VIASGDTFYFDLSDRQCSRDSSSQSFYLTYLGSESSIPSDAVRVESARGVPILLHASPKAGVELNTQPFLSEQTGLIELNRYGIEPMPHRGLSHLWSLPWWFTFSSNSHLSFEPFRQTY